MKLALIRLEDVGPGGYYESVENQAKLLTVADYLHHAGVPFQVAVIPRYVDPVRRINRSMADVSDRVSVAYLQMLRALLARGASLGLHGYTHQYGVSISAEGNEFFDRDCTDHCPPDDSADTLTDYNKFINSYAYRRCMMGVSEFYAAGIRPEWFETPHYTASPTQRRILEACCRLIHEDNPDAPEIRTASYRRPATPFTGGAVYVPTPLRYVGGATVDEDVKRIIEEMHTYGDEQLASFFYHPFLEFPYIRLQNGTNPLYSDHSPLKRLIREFHADDRRFLSIRHLFRLSGRPPQKPPFLDPTKETGAAQQ